MDSFNELGKRYLREWEAKKELRDAREAYKTAQRESKARLHQANLLLTRAQRELERHQDELAKFDKRTERALKTQQDELKRQQDELNRQQDELKSQFAERTLGQRKFLDQQVGGLVKVVLRRTENLEGAGDLVSAAKAREARCIARLKASQADLQAAVRLHNEPPGASAAPPGRVRASAAPPGRVRASAAPPGWVRASAAPQGAPAAPQGASAAPQGPVRPSPTSRRSSRAGRAFGGPLDLRSCGTEGCPGSPKAGKTWCPRCEGRDQRKCFAGLCEISILPGRTWCKNHAGCQWAQNMCACSSCIIPINGRPAIGKVCFMCAKDGRKAI